MKKVSLGVIGSSDATDQSDEKAESAIDHTKNTEEAPAPSLNTTEAKQASDAVEPSSSTHATSDDRIEKSTENTVRVRSRRALSDDSNSDTNSSFTTFAAQPRAVVEGKNINENVTITNAQVNKTNIKPNESENIRLSFDVAIDQRVNAGDYFTLELPAKINPWGITDFQSYNGDFILNNRNGVTIASDVFDKNTNSYRFVFNDDAAGRENIRALVDIPLYMDRERVARSGRQNLIFDMAGKGRSLALDVDYGAYDNHDQSNVKNIVVNYNPETRKYQSIAYINPLGLDAFDTHIYLDAFDNSDRSVPIEKVRIYKTNGKDFSDSFSRDLSQFVNVTDEIPYQNKGQYLDYRFGHINDTYIMVIEGTAQDNSESLNVKVEMSSTDSLAHINKGDRYYSNHWWKAWMSFANPNGSSDGDIVRGPFTETHIYITQDEDGKELSRFVEDSQRQMDITVKMAKMAPPLKRILNQGILKIKMVVG